MNKLGEKLYSVLREEKAGLVLKQPFECSCQWLFKPSLHAMLAENWTFHLFVSLPRSCVSVVMAGFRQVVVKSLAYLVIILVAYPDSLRDLLTQTKHPQAGELVTVLCLLLNSSAITASHCPRLLLESPVLPVQDIFKARVDNAVNSLHEPLNIHGPVTISVSEE